MNSLNNVNKPALTASLVCASIVGYIVYSSYSSTLKTIKEVKSSNVSWLNELIQSYSSSEKLQE